MEKMLRELRERVMQNIDEAKASQSLEQIRVGILGKKGELTGLLRGMGKLLPEERKETDEYTYVHYECDRCGDAEYINHYVAYCIHEISARPNRELTKPATCLADGKYVYTQGWHLPWDTCGPGPRGVPVVSPGCPRFLARSGKKGVFCVFFVYI